MFEEMMWSRIAVAEPWMCWPWLSTIVQDYGMIWKDGRYQKAHRVIFEIWWSVTLPYPWVCVLHNCPGGDNSICCNPAHLWIGTKGDNNRDRAAKGRSATGDKNGARKHPEKLSRGDQHYSRTNPELLARGERNGAYTCPEKRPKGEQHGCRTKPEKIPRGEHHGNSKLTDDQFLEMWKLHKAGASLAELASLYQITKQCAWQNVTGKRHKHLLPVEEQT